MPTLTRTRDGDTRTLVVAESLKFWYLGQGWVVVDPNSTPPAALDYVTQAQLASALALLSGGGGSGGGVDPEGVQDIIAPILALQGWTYNDAANSFSPPAGYDPTGGAAQEAFQDFLGPILTAGGWTYSDATNAFTPPAQSGGGTPGANTVGASQIIDGAVGTNELADGGVTGPKIADGSVGDTEIAVGRALLGSTAAAEYVQDIIGSTLIGGTYDDTAGTYTLPTSSSGGTTVASSSVYEIPLSQIQFYPSGGGTESQRRAVLANNSAVTAKALVEHPGWEVRLPAGKPVPLQVELNEFVGTYTNNAGTQVSFAASQSYWLSGPAQVDCGTLTSKDDTTSTRVLPKSVLTVIRKHKGSVIVPQNLRNTFQLGPNNPSAGSVFSALSTGWEMPAGTYNQVRAGDVISLVSKNGYKWSSRAGYTIVYKGSAVPVAGIVIAVTGYSLTALNTALGLPDTTSTPTKKALDSLERRTLVGATSGTTALLQGDIPGTNQVVASSLSGDFTAGEDLTDQASGAKVGTAGTVTVIMAGTLNTTYDDTPQMRVYNRSSLNLTGLVISPASDVDAVIADYNRSDCVNITGQTDLKLGNARITGGYSAGFVLRSCWDFTGDVDINGLANHAIETAAKESAYGYGVRLLGHCDNFAVTVNGSNLRHNQTTNGIGGTWNLNSRTGSSTGSVELCTNFWNHGCGGRKGVWVGGIARATIGTGWDTHEGAEDMVWINPAVFEPHSVARSTTAPDGITLRGQGMTVLNPFFDGVRIGVVDQAGPLDSDGVSYTNDVIGGVIRNFQLGGISQSEDSFSEAFARFRYRGTLLRGDPTVPNTLYAQYGILTRRGNTATDGLRIEAVNDRYVRHTSYVDPNGAGSTATGHVTHDNISFDQADSRASRIFSDEDTYDTLEVVRARAWVNPTNGTQRPLFWFTDEGTTTPVRYRDLIATPLGTTKTTPQLITRTTGSAPTPVRILDVGETTGSAAPVTHVTSVAPTLTLQTAAGTGATAVFASGSTDVSGEIRLTTGTASQTSGTQVRLNYGTAFGADVFPVLGPGLNVHTRALGYTTHDATGVTFTFGNAPGVSTEYRWSYYVPGV